MSKKLMRISALTIALVVLIAAIQLRHTYEGAVQAEGRIEKIYGGTNMGINFWFEDTSPQYFDELLPKISATNAHIKVGVQHLVDTAAGYTVTPMDDSDFTVIKSCIEKAQALGISVDMLMIYMEDKALWSRPIAPTGTNIDTFFYHYKAAALKVAALCQTYGIPIIGLVNECDALTDSDKTSYWAQVTEAIRQANPMLQMTCASTAWNGEIAKLLGYKETGTDNICNYLDFIGMNLYPKLTTVPVAEVTEAQLLNGWYGRDYPTASTRDCSMVELIEKTSTAYKKPVLITEIGCVPNARGLEDPLYNTTPKRSAALNPHVQYLYLKTAYQVLGRCDAVAGIYIWDACDSWTPFYWLDNKELVPYITDYYERAFSAVKGGNTDAGS